MPESEHGSRCCGQMDPALTMAKWEPQQCAHMDINGGPATVFWALGPWRSSTPSCGRLDLRLMWRLRRETHCKRMELDQWQCLATPKLPFDERLPSAGPGAAITQADELDFQGTPRPCHRDRDWLRPGTLWHPWKWRGGPSGTPGPRCQQRHSERAAIHLGLELS